MDRKYNYLLVYDDCLDIDDSWDDDQIEQYVTDLAYNCAYKATDILIQHYKDFCFHDNTPLTKDKLLSDTFKSKLKKMHVLVKDPSTEDDGLFILVDDEFNWIDRDFTAMRDGNVLLEYTTGDGSDSYEPMMVDEIVDFDSL